MDNYTVPANTRIGHVHLKVSNLERALAFYRGLLGFELMQQYGTQAAFILLEVTITILDEYLV
jgi:catechol 2,3-dioxygenase